MLRILALFSAFLFFCFAIRYNYERQKLEAMNQVGVQTQQGSTPIQSFDDPNYSSEFGPPTNDLSNKELRKNRNYYSTLLNDRYLYRWGKARLGYYIDRSTARRLNLYKVKRALRHWEKKSQVFRFYQTSNPNNADITITMNETSQNKFLGEAGPDKLVKGKVFRVNGKDIQEAQILHASIVLSKEHFGFDKMQKYGERGTDVGFMTLVHEMGHVLGIMSHSPDTRDCMYWKADADAKACDSLTSDANTLKLLYGKSGALQRTYYDSSSYALRR